MRVNHPTTVFASLHLACGSWLGTCAGSDVICCNSNIRKVSDSLFIYENSEIVSNEDDQNNARCRLLSILIALAPQVLRLIGEKD
jgi:hypothetical protein